MLCVRVTESIVMRTAAFHLHFMSLLSLSQDYKSSSSTMPTFSHSCVQAQDQVQIELAQSPETAWYTAWDTETGPGRIQAIHCPSPKMISCIICQWESDLLSPQGTLEVVTWYLIQIGLHTKMILRIGFDLKFTFPNIDFKLAYVTDLLRSWDFLSHL